ncbi:hypothetical protein AVEN_159506-1 [Araneus ventricosus]|uniref:BRCT domain-containing protein n=1 Tax=Araneus ventricosus TaxID=182803 RepID=A0A4Y2A290_ARAVE|nr:hypothetical protein AVEN_159506-1 [Araneus ventricosus]
MAVSSSHVKGGGSGQTASVHPFIRALPRDLPSHSPFERRDWSEFHRAQSTSSNLEVLPSHTPWEQGITFFVLYDGSILKDHETSEASHVICNGDNRNGSIPKKAEAITVDWLWDSIKLQKRLPTKMYKPKAKC